jgi:hypothetical protein
MSAKKIASAPANPNCYYAFGQKSAALLGLLLTSDGQVTAFAYQRPQPANPAADPASMVELYRSRLITASGRSGLVPFTLSLAADKVGLLTIEPLIWNKPYESNRTHFLGMLNPFGADEIPFPSFGGTSRRGDIPSNRVFAGTFAINPNAADPKQRAVLTLTDVESHGEGVETVSISSFDDPATNRKGGLFVAIRVNRDNYTDGCATLEFTGGHTVNVTVSGNPAALSRLVLNTDASPLPRSRPAKQTKPRK